MKVCILAAGRGTRMGAFAGMTHKALLPLGNRAVISHIMDQFDADARFVIAIGDRGDQIVSYVRLAHPDRQVEFVHVANYDGPGSGPGLSLYTCRQQLQEPFYFTACDTLVPARLPHLEENWIGVQRVDDPRQWCSVCVNTDGQVTAVFYKSPAPTDQAFIGLAYVRDYAVFWQGFERNAALLGGELQVNNGLCALIPCRVRAVTLAWCDTGNERQYHALAQTHAKALTFEGKTTDVTYREGDRIIKFFEDAHVTRARFERARAFPGVFAEVLDCQGNFFSCRFHDGPLLSHCLNYSTCRAFLAWAAAHVWRHAAVDAAAFAAAVRAFYHAKTLQRLHLFLERFPTDSEQHTIAINGLPCHGARALVAALPDAFFSAALPSTYHGDLHADNIICTQNEYRLIDWRHAFASMTDVGDRYYDIGKFLHTLELSVQTMAAGNYAISGAASRVCIAHRMDWRELDAYDAFWDFVARHGYDARRIRIVDALIYLNMAPLYAEPMARYLYFLGRYLLQRAVTS
jgi:molybdopterin-guanine dinucleotide biosynthesis protein A